MKCFAVTLVALFALAAVSVPAEAANNNWDLAKSPSRPSVSGFRADGGNGNGNANVNNGNFNDGNVTNVSRHHHHSGSSYGRSSYPYGSGYGYGGYPVYGNRNYGYGGYGYNTGIPAASFANPTSFGFGPGAVFGW